MSKVSTPPAALPMQSSKSSKNIKIVKLKVSKQLLASFVENVPVLKATETKAKASPKTPAKPLLSNAIVSKATVKSEIETTPVGDGEETQFPGKSLSEGDKKNPKAGLKREAPASVDGDGKAKLKAPLRKRPKV